MPKTKLISFVLPVFNEEKGITKFYAELNKILEILKSEYEFEVIFINDGSKDLTLEYLIKLSNDDNRIKVINFSRNFGHQLAITAGLDYSLGEAVIIMDTDLQDPPATAIELIRKWEEGYEIVYAQRRTRVDGYLKKITANIFYNVLDKLAEIEIPKNTGDFRLMDRKAVDYLNKFREKNRFMRGLSSYLGFKQIAILFDRHERFAGQTHYSIKKMFKLATDGLIGFSTTPITLVGYLSGIFTVLGLLIFLPALILSLSLNSVIFLLITVLSFIFTLFGIQGLFISVIGIYIGRIYAEVLNRPLYMISSIIKH